MKKFILFLFLAIFTQVSTFSQEVINNSESTKAQKELSEIGFTILNANGIDKRMVFIYSSKDTINAATSNRSREIVFYRGLYNMLKDNHEIAAVLAHEISHGVDSYDGIMRGSFSGLSYYLSPKKYEYKADKRAVDFLVNAGYHPVAFITAMNKFAGQYRYDWNSTHPLVSRRLAEVYEYIYKKYPEYLVNNPYKNDVYYQNFLLTSRQNRKELQKKIESKSKSSPNYL